ncbi:hypothetical protein RAZWK3B_06432 [Roseobacter sp. AzwK-3b]|uniref:hypothetical protein n=1 Tax=Roseobacter sp. AzwK-3b TaxID=351016 RepID=UPI000156A3CE|nr:hypothetical protein [Roseobacter sp. AzwK-3b]EDM70305.1 hypothetical protein RAZWK3B_06432 [Roseobacter sp. AzwK-3b]
MALNKLLVLLSVALLAGCGTSKTEKRAQLLEQPVDCMTAQADIAALQAAMPKRGERAVSAVRLVTPVGLATGAIKGENRDKTDIVSGRTAEELEAYIALIEATCAQPVS